MKKEQTLTFTLFIIYLVILTWIILFKLQLPTKPLPHVRNLNLIPFGQSMIVNGKIAFNEIIDNAIIFVPMGVYLGMLKSDWPFIRKLLPVIGISAAYEIGQYIFALGMSDITDIITNTLGGAFGLLIFFLLTKLWKEKTCRILNVIALICTILLSIFLTILIAAN